MTSMREKKLSLCSSSIDRLKGDTGVSPSCMLLRQFQFCVEIPYQLSFRAIIAKEGNILCCCFIYFS